MRHALPGGDFHVGKGVQSSFLDAIRRHMVIRVRVGFGHRPVSVVVLSHPDSCIGQRAG
jgi:hypothetical protein